jgi:hypothetical protein
VDIEVTLAVEGIVGRLVPLASCAVTVGGAEPRPMAMAWSSTTTGLTLHTSGAAALLVVPLQQWHKAWHDLTPSHTTI